MSVPQNKNIRKITPQPEAIWSVYTDDWICLVLMLVLLILLFFVRHCHLLCLNVFDSLMGHLGLTWESETVISPSKFNDYYNMHVWLSWPNDKMFILIKFLLQPYIFKLQKSEQKSIYIVEIKSLLTLQLWSNFSKTTSITLLLKPLKFEILIIRILGKTNIQRHSLEKKI